MRYCPDCGGLLVAAERDGRQRQVCAAQACGYVAWDNPTPVVAAVVERPDGVVLVRAAGWPEKWFGLVTGFLEPRESPDAAVLREVREELGLAGELVGLIGAYPFPERNQVILAYHVRADGTIRLGGELEGFRVIPVERLRPWPGGTGLAVRDWLARERSQPDRGAASEGDAGVWTVERLEEALREFEVAALVAAAIELEVFAAAERLAGEATAESLAAALGVDGRRLRAMLDGLAWAGLLTRTGGQYRVAAQLRSGSPEEGGPLDRIGILGMRLQAWSRLAEAVRRGRPVVEPANLHSPQDLRRFHLALYAGARDIANETVGALEVDTATHLLDLGGGAGAYTLAALRRAPALRATLFDRPEVLEIARYTLAAAGVLERVTLRPGDFLVDALGGGYDRLLLSNIVHIYCAETNRSLLRRCHAALAPGGLIGVKDFFLDREALAPRDAVFFAVNMAVFTDDGDAYSPGEMAAWLEAAGFAEVRPRILASARASGIVLACRAGTEPSAG